jgi:acyl-CoA thioesterase-2
MTEPLSLSSRLAMSSVCDIEQIDDNLFRSTAVYRVDGGPRHGGRGNPLFGGQAAAQALLAAVATVRDREPHSLHAYFLRPGRSDEPIDFRVERERDGRSYSSRRVAAIQDGETIFSMSASFRVHRDEGVGPDSRAQMRQDVPDPENCEPLDVEPEIALEVRMCSKPSRAQYFPTLFWARPHQLAGDSHADSAAAVAYLSDFSSGLPREHNLGVLGPSLDHALWLHRPFLWSDWVLVDLKAGIATQGRGHYTGTITDRRGEPVASFAQEMVYLTPR